MQKLLSKMMITTLLLSTITFSNSAVVPEGTKLAKNQIYRGSLGSNPPTLDPNYAYDASSASVLINLFETLVRFDPNEGKYVDYGAESHFVSEDLKTWTFNLRKDAVWTDGKPVTAHDYVYSWRRIVDPKIATSFATYLRDSLNIVNADDIINGKKPVVELGVRAIDDYILEITTVTPVPWLYTAISYVALAPVRKDVIEKYGADWTKPHNIVSNGPFKLDRYILNERIDLIKNENYRDSNSVVITGVSLPIVSSAIISYNRFVSGEVDITGIPRQFFEKAKKEGRDIKTKLNKIIFGLGINLELDKFKDIRVREALRLVINNEAITSKVIRNNNQPIYRWVPKGISESEEIQEPNYGSYVDRVNKAKQLIKNAGYSKSNPLKIDFLYSTSEFAKTLFVAYQDQINKAFNGSVITSLENVEYKVFLDRVRKGQFEVTSKGWAQDFDNASNFLTIFLSNSSSNDIKFLSEEFDELYNKVLLTSDSKDRAKIFAKMDNLLTSSYSVIPVYQHASNYLINPKLKGLFINADDRYIQDYYFIE